MTKKRQQLFIINNPFAPRLCPELAVEIGLNESIILLQIEFWIGLKPKERDGRLWTYQSLRKIKECFPFWGTETINRALHSLQTQHLILIRNYNRTSYDRTRWFALDPRGFKKLHSVQIVDSEPVERHFSKWEMEVVKTGNRSGQNETTIPENTTENTTERESATRASSPSSLTKKPKTLSANPSSSVLADVLSEVTGSRNRKKLATDAARLATELSDLSSDLPGDLRRIYGAGGAWYTLDWRGKKGSPPNAGTISETFKTLRSDAATGSTKPKTMRR
jgi:hypothetical protein